MHTIQSGIATLAGFRFYTKINYFVIYRINKGGVFQKLFTRSTYCGIVILRETFARMDARNKNS